LLAHHHHHHHTLFIQETVKLQLLLQYGIDKYTGAGTIFWLGEQKLNDFMVGEAKFD